MFAAVCCEESAQANLSLFLNVFDVLVHFKAAIAATKVVLKVPRLGMSGFLKATDQYETVGDSTFWDGEVSDHSFSIRPWL